MEISDREGEVFPGPYFSIRVKYYLEPTMECLAIKIDKFSFYVNHSGLYFDICVKNNPNTSYLDTYIFNLH